MNIESLIRGEVKQEDLLSWYNTIIIYDTLPKTVKGYVFSYDIMNFIIINKNLSYYKKKKTILHELAHIELNQLCQSNKDLFEYCKEIYENEVDKYINNIKIF